MDDEKPNFTVIPGGGGAVIPLHTGSAAQGSPPLPPGELSDREQAVWEYICAQLRAVGMEHRTAGFAMVAISKTYVEYLDALDKLAQVRADTGTTWVKTPNGYEQPHQAVYRVDALEKKLRDWLPECCLTIPSLVNARSKVGDAGLQDDLFSDLVGHGNEERSAYSRR